MKPRLFLYGSSFGSHRPIIPTATSVSLARVASPFSTGRVYQPLFLRALKTHFETSKRLVKKGDMIAVGINTDNQHSLANKLEDFNSAEFSSYRTQYAPD
jgi:peroxin-6